MAVSKRSVKNKRDNQGKLTGHPGVVYDVNIKYKTPDGYKAYVKKGFISHDDAVSHEAEMKVKLTKRPSVIASLSENGKQTLSNYIYKWIERYGKTNLRPTTLDGYKSNIKNHIVPQIGHLQLRQITPEAIDDMLINLLDGGLSTSSVRYCHRVLSVALESARKYHYIEDNPARDILTKFGAQGDTPEPYTIAQLQKLLAGTAGTEYEMVDMLGALYGLRVSEIIGLRWHNVDLDAGTFSVKEQLPKLPAGTKIIPDKLPPVKSHSRILPITDFTRPYFEGQQKLQNRQKQLCSLSGTEYFENDLVVAQANGSPYNRSMASEKFSQTLKRLNMPHIRFHDLRHTAATNMHELTGDFYTVSQILGHSLKGMGIELGLSGNFDSVTARYVDVRMDRKKAVLNTYHKEVFKPHKKEDMQR